MTWSIYILECSDNSYYVGHSNDVQSRLNAHNAGQGAIYTLIRRPCHLVYQEDFESKADAVKRERQIKKWSRGKKQALISGNHEQLRLLSKKQADR